MAGIERTRQVISGQIGLEDLRSKLEEGWKPVAIEWEREVAPGSPTQTALAPKVPFGLRVAGDCAHLEEDPRELEVLFQIMELTIQDGPYSGIADELNRRGYRTRQGNKWSPVSVFQMMPRLIEAGPAILNSDEWRQRRQGLKIAGSE
jgi:Recombinase